MNCSMQRNETCSIKNGDIPSHDVAVMMIISTAAILFNFTVFYTVPKLKGKLKSSTRYAMLNLAMTDSLLGLTSFVTRIVYLKEMDYDYVCRACKAESYIYPLLVTVTIFTLVFLNMDRYISLLLPNKWKEWMTSRRSIYILLTIWMFCLLRSILTTFADETIHSRRLQGTYLCVYNYLCNEGTVTINLAMMNTVVLFVLLLFGVFVSSVAFYQVIKTQTVCIMKRKTKQAWKAAVVVPIFLLTTLYIFMYTPFLILVVSREIFLKQISTNPTVNFFTTWLAGANSALNPFIYIITLRSYREALFPGTTTRGAGQQSESRKSTFQQNETKF